MERLNSDHLFFTDFDFDLWADAEILNVKPGIFKVQAVMQSLLNYVKHLQRSPFRQSSCSCLHCFAPLLHWKKLQVH